jgi:hypothetical protein
MRQQILGVFSGDLATPRCRRDQSICAFFTCVAKRLASSAGPVLPVMPGGLVMHRGMQKQPSIGWLRFNPEQNFISLSNFFY